MNEPALRTALVEGALILLEDTKTTASPPALHQAASQAASSREKDDDAWCHAIESISYACTTLGVEDLVLTAPNAQHEHEAHALMKDIVYQRYKRYPIIRGFDVDRDPGAVLRAILAPVSLAKTTGAIRRLPPSLHNFLCAFVASPQGASSDAVRVALFAAAVMVSSPSSWRYHFNVDRRIAGIGQEALKWLADQLPSRAFGESLEEAIRSVSEDEGESGPPVPLAPPPVGPVTPPAPARADTMEARDYRARVRGSAVTHAPSAVPTGGVRT